MMCMINYCGNDGSNNSGDLCMKHNNLKYVLRRLPAPEFLYMEQVNGQIYTRKFRT